MKRILACCLIGGLWIACPTLAQSGTPLVKPLMIVPPEELQVWIDYGGMPCLVFNEPMWVELSRLLYADREKAVMAGAEAAVRAAVAPLRAELGKRVWRGWRSIAIGAAGIAGVLTLVVIAR